MMDDHLDEVPSAYVCEGSCSDQKQGKECVLPYALPDPESNSSEVKDLGGFSDEPEGSLPVNDIEIPSLKNFQKRSSFLYCSAQPFPWHLIKLRKKGIDVVINFSLVPDLALEDGPKHLIHIPALGMYPSLEDVIDFLQVLHYVRERRKGGARHKVLVHCTSGGRYTHLMLAIYEVVFEKKDIERRYALFDESDQTYLRALLGNPEQVENLRKIAMEGPRDQYLFTDFSHFGMLQ